MTNSRPTLKLAAALLLTPSLLAQQVPSQQQKDPANLTGERVTPQAPADTLEINHGPAALQQLLVKLRTRASLMLIVAHPDDEDGGMLTYESRGKGARVAMLTLTRGEGGQNLMTADFNDALGLIRTQELLAADRYEGVDQFFGTEVDFGFSKTLEEALAQWTHERVLYDAVRAVRLYRPLILASVFVGGPTDGHGHHQTAGEICQEVFTAAADPKVFPEMIAEGLLPWAPQKVYARVPFSRVGPDGMFDYATGKTIPTRFHNYVTNTDTSEPPVATVNIPEGEKSTFLGMHGDSYVQFARKGLALQKTQIGGNTRLAPAGAFDSGYTRMGSRLFDSPASEKSFFDGIDTSLPSIATLAPDAPATLRSTLATIDSQIADAQSRFTPDNIELAAPPLRDALRTLDTLLASIKDDNLPDEQAFNLLHELRTKRVQLNNALALAHHLSCTATLTQPNPNQPVLSTVTSLAAQVVVKSDSANSFQVLGTTLLVNSAGQGLFQPAQVEIQPRTTREFPIQIPYLAGLPTTRPYFSRPNLDQPYYTIANPNLRNAPATPNPITAGATIDDQGVQIELETTLLAPQSTSNPDLVPQPLVVIPPISVSLSPSTGIVSPGESSFPLTASLTVRTLDATACGASPQQQAKLAITAPPAWSVSPEAAGFDPRCASGKTYPFTLATTHKPTVNSVLAAQAVARMAARNYVESFRAAGYPGLTYTNIYTPAIYKATAIDVHTAPNLKIAYLPGTGDSTADFLPQLGIKPTTLTPADLTAANLAQYDAVLIGVRAYATQAALAGKGSQPLLDYAKAGGVVILQYMTAKYGDAEAPYPISVPGDSAHNVVVEAQPVTILAPQSPALTWPNKIEPSDFTHWTEEWGHGFAATWDSHYESLLEVHDPEQDPQRGGLLLARIGKGAYIYCALALYRQLPEGVPGAYRLLANLISLRHNTAFTSQEPTQK